MAREPYHLRLSDAIPVQGYANYLLRVKECTFERGENGAGIDQVETIGIGARTVVLLAYNVVPWAVTRIAMWQGLAGPLQK